MFYNDLSVYKGFGGVVLAKDEGVRIAAELGPTNKNIILQNHGLLTAGGTVDEAAGFFIALERACQTQIIVTNMILCNEVTKAYVGEEEAEYTKKQTGSPEVMYWQFKPEYELMLRESGGDFLR
jgi:ribulose-5-phosphate 4-epimerase/fuculose-1-phosphate aldolase